MSPSTGSLPYRGAPTLKSLIDALCPPDLGPQHWRDAGRRGGPGLKFDTPQDPFWITPTAVRRNPDNPGVISVTGTTLIERKRLDVWTEGTIHRDGTGEMHLEERSWLVGYRLDSRPDELFKRHFSRGQLVSAFRGSKIGTIKAERDSGDKDEVLLLPLAIRRDPWDHALEVLAWLGDEALKLRFEFGSSLIMVRHLKRI
jgi:hypothetical protein